MLLHRYLAPKEKVKIYDPKNNFSEILGEKKHLKET
jgi:hypothetical protein